VLSDWDRSAADFVKVMPTHYKRVLCAQAAAPEARRMVVEAAD